MDCFATLAMTGRQPGSDRRGGHARHPPFPLRPKTLYGARSLRAWRNLIHDKYQRLGIRLAPLEGGVTRYISTRGEAPVLGFCDVMLTGLARDGGLYVPEVWPQLSAATIA